MDSIRELYRIGYGPSSSHTKVMNQTGHDLSSLYRETSCGGLARNYRFPPQK